MQRFSKKWVYGVLRKASAHLELSDIDDSIKRHSRGLPIITWVNPSLITTAAQVYVMRKNFHDCSRIPKQYKDWTVEVDGKPSYMVMEISAHHVYWEPAKEVSNTIVHEYSHILDFIENGYNDRSAKEVHNEDWEAIHVALGQKPNQFCNVPIAPRCTEIYRIMSEKYANEDEP